MSTGLDAWIEERDDGFWFGIEDPFSHRFDPEYNVEGPFATVADLVRAWRQHANPGGMSVDLKTMTHEEFNDRWNEASK